MPGDGKQIKVFIGNRMVDYIPANAPALAVETAAGTRTVIIDSAGTLVADATTITAATAAAIAVGPNGATNPSFQVNTATASAATGVKITAAAAAGGVAIAAISSGADESVTIDAKGTGTITLNSVATGEVIIGNGATITTGGLTVTAGGLTVTADGLTVTAGGATITAGGLTVTADGLTVTAGGATITAGGLTVTAGGATVTAGGVTITAGGLLVTAGRIREVMTATDVDTQNHTLTVANIVAGIVVHTTTTGGGTVTTDTAVNIVAGATGVGALTANGQTIVCYYVNDGNQTATFQGGDGVTVADTAQTVAENESAILVFLRTSATAVTMYIIGA
ncbi:MAG: hypothetical protein WC211_03615 [Dehalococcoidia bacterium]